MNEIIKNSENTKNRLNPNPNPNHNPNPSINPLLSEISFSDLIPRTSEKLNGNYEEILNSNVGGRLSNVGGKRLSHILPDGSINHIRILKPITTSTNVSDNRRYSAQNKSFGNETQRHSVNLGQRVSTFLNIKKDPELDASESVMQPYSARKSFNEVKAGGNLDAPLLSTDFQGIIGSIRRPSILSFQKSVVILQKLTGLQDQGINLNLSEEENLSEKRSSADSGTHSFLSRVSSNNFSRTHSKDQLLRNDQGSIFVTALRTSGNATLSVSPIAEENNLSTLVNRSETSDNVDYASYFPSYVGEIEGVFIFIIESMRPVLLDSSEHGSFCIADCYIIMNSTLKNPEKNDGDLSHTFYTWIGVEAETDKRFCCAMYAVALRNLVRSNARIIREVAGDESEAFLHTFLQSDGSTGVTLLDATHGTETGLFSANTKEYPIKLYRIDQKSQNLMFLVEKNRNTLSTNHVYLLDAGMEIYQWNGKNATLQNRSKARMIAARINKQERVGKAEFTEFEESEESANFWDALDFRDDDEVVLDEDFPISASMESLQLYRVFPKQAPELEFHIIASGIIKKGLLVTDGIYVLDAGTELSLWIGKKAWIELKNAATDLLRAIAASKTRPSWISVNKYAEDAEPESFKLQFCDWQEKSTIITTKSLKNKQSSNVDAILSPYTLYPADVIDCEDTMEFINSSLETFSSFVYHRGKFITLPEEEKGHFFEQDAYVFLCVYRATETQLNTILDHPLSDFDIPEVYASESVLSENEDTSLSCVVYFCQSRKTSKVPYSNFKLTTQKEMEELVKGMYKCPLKVKLVDYGMEPFALLAHLENSYTLHHGSRLDLHSEVKNKNIDSKKRLYQIRTDIRYQTTRAVQIDLQKSPLISRDCFLFMNDFFSETDPHTLWRGNDYDKTLVEFAIEPVKKIIKLLEKPTLRDFSFDENANSDKVDDNLDLNTDSVLPPSVRYIENTPKYHSSNRNEEFIPLISIPFDPPKLFFCSCNPGFFKVERYGHFIQKTLSVESCVMIDPGSDYPLYVWFGSQCSETIRKLGRKSAMVWLNNCQDGRRFRATNETCDLFDDVSSISSTKLLEIALRDYSIRFVDQGNEPEEFKAFFVAWDPEIFKIEEPGNLFTRAQGRQGWQGSKTVPPI